MVSKISRELRYRTSEFCHHIESLSINLAMVHTEYQIPRRYLKQGPSKTIGDAIEVYRKALVEDAGKGWRMLMDADRFTTRDFLLL